MMKTGCGGTDLRYWTAGNVTLNEGFPPLGTPVSMTSVPCTKFFARVRYVMLLEGVPTGV
jgi:hypothetical protein